MLLLLLLVPVRVETVSEAILVAGKWLINSNVLVLREGVMCIKGFKSVSLRVFVAGLLLLLSVGTLRLLVERVKWRARGTLLLLVFISITS